MGTRWLMGGRPGLEGVLEWWAGTQERPGGGRGTKCGEMGAGPCREEGGAHPSHWGHTEPEPQAPPLSSEGARSWFPAPAWEPETTEGAVIAPRCLQGMWAMGEAALKFPPRQVLSPGGASPGHPSWPSGEMGGNRGSEPQEPGTLWAHVLLTIPTRTRTHTGHSWGVVTGASGSRGRRQRGEPGKWVQRGRWVAPPQPCGGHSPIHMKAVGAVGVILGVSAPRPPSPVPGPAGMPSPGRPRRAGPGPRPVAPVPGPSCAARELSEAGHRLSPASEKCQCGPCPAGWSERSRPTRLGGGSQGSRSGTGWGGGQGRPRLCPGSGWPGQWCRGTWPSLTCPPAPAPQAPCWASAPPCSP